MAEHWNILIIGAGAAGMPAAIFASRAGARVLVAEAADKIGGTFHLSTGQMSAAGTRLQAAKGIHDTPQMHFEDVMRISRGTANPALVRLAVEHAADTLHWLLDNGFEALPEHPIIHLGHEPYLTPRTYWSRDEGRGVLAAIAPQYAAETQSGGITTWLRTALVRLTKNSSGAVTGAVLRRDGQEVEVTASSVILAAGGYSANAGMFEKLSGGRKLHGGGYGFSQGQGLKAAEEAGGEIINTEKFLPSFAAVEDPDARGGSTILTDTTPQSRPPWEIYVDVNGSRFMREDDPSVDARERALLQQPDMSFWVVYDEAIRLAAPPLFVLPDGAMSRFGKLPGYQRADSLAELARQTGMDAEALNETIATYNASVRTGTADAFGRESRPMPIEAAPFYAVRHLGWSIVGFAGIKVDEALRVLDHAGQPIPHLYAAGEMLGFAATSGDSFTGGMSVTPAMTFGRLLGDRLAKAAKTALAA